MIYKLNFWTHKKKKKTQKLKDLDSLFTEDTQESAKDHQSNEVSRPVDSTVKIHTGESKQIKIAKSVYTHRVYAKIKLWALQPDSGV